MKLPLSILFRAVWKYLEPVLSRIDRALVAFAALFGTSVTSRTRPATMLLSVFALLYALSFVPIPAVSLGALVVGYLGVLAIGRAWVANEWLRTRVVKKLANDDPDALPDLRLTALLSAVQLLILFPLLFRQLQIHYELFKVPPQAEGNFFPSFAAWEAFTLEGVSRTLVDVLGLGELAGGFEERTKLASALVIVERLTIELLLLQAVVRLYAIWTTVSEGVGALKQDTDLTRRVGKRATLPLIDILQSPDADLRRRAASVLGDLKDPRAVPALIRALGDADPDVRWQAAEALGQLGKPETGPALVQCLRDPSETVRRAALHALGKLPGVEVSGPLLALVRSNQETPPVRATAIEALAERGERDALPVIVEALRDPADEVRKSAVLALGQLHDPRAVAPLTEVVTSAGSSGWFKGEAVRALEALGDRSVVPVLLKALEDRDEFVRRTACHALGKLGDWSVVPALIAALHDPSYHVRESAALALAQRKDARALPELLPLLQDEHEEVREAVAEAVSAIGDREVVPGLLAVLRQGTPPGRRLAAELLGKFSDPRGVPSLLEALRDEDAETRGLAAWALGQVGDEGVVPALEKAQQDADLGVRDRAAEAVKAVQTRHSGGAR